MMRRGPKIVRLRKPKVADDTQLVETLVWLLDRARSGKCTGYAIVCEIDGASIECASPFSELDRLHVLGMIEKMKMSYCRREWPEAGITDTSSEPL